MLIVILIGLAFIGVIVGLKVLDNETDWDVDISIYCSCSNYCLLATCSYLFLFFK